VPLRTVSFLAHAAESSAKRIGGGPACGAQPIVSSTARARRLAHARAKPDQAPTRVDPRQQLPAMGRGPLRRAHARARCSNPIKIRPSAADSLVLEHGGRQAAGWPIAEVHATICAGARQDGSRAPIVVDTPMRRRKARKHLTAA